MEVLPPESNGQKGRVCPGARLHSRRPDSHSRNKVSRRTRSAHRLDSGSRRHVDGGVLFRDPGSRRARGSPSGRAAANGVNILINSILGALPGIGDLFSAWFKSNQQNYRLLQAPFLGRHSCLHNRGLDFSYRAGHDRARHCGHRGSRGRLPGLSNGFGALRRVVSALSAHLRALAELPPMPSACIDQWWSDARSPSRILLIGQAPGDQGADTWSTIRLDSGQDALSLASVRPRLGRRNARNRIYFAAVCRCFPGKDPRGGDRVPE